MNPINLVKFHELNRKLDFSGVMKNLLGEVQQDRIADRFSHTNIS